METKITEQIIAQSDLAVNNATTTAMSYYERTNDIIKRTHVAMGRTIKYQTTTIASTINGLTITSNTARNPTTV